ESNRVLIINALTEQPRPVHNLSNARDTETMLELLGNSKKKVLDVKDAGTTMRFLTAFLALKGEGQVLTGTDRMKERPIGPLVNALTSIGAKIDYLEQSGFPPLEVNAIKSQKIKRLEIPGNISSQYISALLMIAPLLPDGLEISLTTEVFSRPYIEMTLEIMKKFGAEFSWKKNHIIVEHKPYQAVDFTVENDWSGASYWYSFVALGAIGSKVFLPNLRASSRQGDSAIAKIMEHFGVKSTFDERGVHVEKVQSSTDEVVLDFKDCPDLAQTVMVSAAIENTRFEMTGLESLRIKETDRIQAMKEQLSKIGASLKEANGKWELRTIKELPEYVHIDTYEDHRMAMAFAPACQKMNLSIEEPAVVKKSYPTFWEELQKVGFEFSIS
ncbi:MAG: 3-phosphoshikimate 1-carboxyvinyltransferase, partial [Bacteroidota bacterium]